MCSGNIHTQPYNSSTLNTLALCNMHICRHDMTNCLYEASVQKIEETCQCAPLAILPSNYSTCEGQGKLCMSSFMEDIGSLKHVVDGGETKECLVSCQDQTYQFLMTAAAYPNLESFRLGEDFCLVLGKLRRSCQTDHKITLDMKYPDLCEQITNTNNLTCEAVKCNSTTNDQEQLHKAVAQYARDNLSVLDIYIKDPYVKLYLRREKITIISFIGNIGGLLGLFMGFSFISTIEIFYVFFLSSDNQNAIENSVEHITTNEKHVKKRAFQ